MSIHEKQSCSDEMTLLFKKYTETKNIDIRNQILMQYSYIANSIALQMRGIISSFAGVEDMVNHGILTLIDCIERFEVDKGVKFETYAFLRVRGSIIDFVRKQDWIPRRARKLSKDVKKAYDTLSTKLLREPKDEEIANELGITIDVLNKNYRDIAAGSTVSFENLLDDQKVDGNRFYDSGSSPEVKFINAELREKIKESIDSLTEKERTVVSLYYYDNLKLREIAEVLGVSESRVCQIHSKIIFKMKNNLNNYVRD